MGMDFRQNLLTVFFLSLHYLQKFNLETKCLKPAENLGKEGKLKPQELHFHPAFRKMKKMSEFLIFKIMY